VSAGFFSEEGNYLLSRKVIKRILRIFFNILISGGQWPSRGAVTPSYLPLRTPMVT